MMYQPRNGLASVPQALFALFLALAATQGRGQVSITFTGAGAQQVVRAEAEVEVSRSDGTLVVELEKGTLESSVTPFDVCALTMVVGTTMPAGWSILAVAPEVALNMRLEQGPKDLPAGLKFAVPVPPIDLRLAWLTFAVKGMINGKCEGFSYIHSPAGKLP